MEKKLKTPYRDSLSLTLGVKIEVKWLKTRKNRFFFILYFLKSVFGTKNDSEKHFFIIPEYKNIFQNYSSFWGLVERVKGSKTGEN